MRNILNCLRVNENRTTDACSEKKIIKSWSEWERKAAWQQNLFSLILYHEVKEETWSIEKKKLIQIIFENTNKMKYLSPFFKL